MKELAEYTSDEKEKEMLLSMATTMPEGKELYKGWVQDSCRHTPCRVPCPRASETPVAFVIHFARS